MLKVAKNLKKGFGMNSYDYYHRAQIILSSIPPDVEEDYLNVSPMQRIHLSLLLLQQL